MNRETKMMIVIGGVLVVIWFLFLFLIIAVSSAQIPNLCSYCEDIIPAGYILKITTFKASDSETLKRWVEDFISEHKVIKIDNSKFPESITLYYIERNKNEHTTSSQ